MPMSWYTRMLNQKATYWTTEPDGYGGYTYVNQGTIQCRWEDKSELFRDAEGNEVMSNAEVFVNQTLEVEGYLYKGESVASSPPNDARQIRQFHEIPSIDARISEYKAWL